MTITKSMTLRLTAEQHRDLVAIGRVQGKSAQEVVREAIDAHLVRHLAEASARAGRRPPPRGTNG